MKITENKKNILTILKENIMANDQKAFQILPSSNIKKNGYSSAYVTELICNLENDDNFKFIPKFKKIYPSSELAIIENLGLIEKGTITNLDNSSVSKNRHTRAILKVTVNNIETAIKLFNKTIYFRKHGKIIQYYINYSDTHFKNIQSGKKELANLFITKSGTLINGICAYNLGKEDECYITKNSDNSITFNFWAHGLESKGFVINEISNYLKYGMFSCLNDDIENNIPSSKISLALSKFNKVKIETKNLNNIAIYMGIFKNNKNKEFMKSNALINSSWLKNAFFERLKDIKSIKKLELNQLNSNIIDGLTIEAAPFGFNCTFLAINQSTIEYIIKSSKLFNLSKDDIVYIKKEDKQLYSLQKTFNKIIKNPNMLTKITGKLLIIYDNENDKYKTPNILVDLSSIIAPFSLTSNSGLNIIDISDSEITFNQNLTMNSNIFKVPLQKNFWKTSSLLNNIISSCNNKSYKKNNNKDNNTSFDYFNKTLEENNYFDSLLNEYDDSKITDEYKSFFKGKGKIKKKKLPKRKIIANLREKFKASKNNNINTPQITPPLNNIIINSINDSNENNNICTLFNNKEINNKKLTDNIIIKSKCANLYRVPDLANLFGISLLKSNEVYSTSNKLNELKKFIIYYDIEFNAPMCNIVSCVSKNDYLRRASNALSSKDYKIFKELLDNMISSNIIYPSEKAIKKITVITDETFINIFNDN